MGKLYDMRITPQKKKKKENLWRKVEWSLSEAVSRNRK